jgi:hypothetical protein
VTVVATGYGPRARRQAGHDLEQPTGEQPAARFGGARSRGGGQPRGDALAVGDLQVPEFVPR